MAHADREIVENALSPEPLAKPVIGRVFAGSWQVKGRSAGGTQRS